MSKYSSKKLQVFLRRVSAKILRPDKFPVGLMTALVFGLFFQTAVAADFAPDPGNIDLKTGREQKCKKLCDCFGFTF